MIRLTKKSAKAIGLPPGELVHIGEPRTHKVKLRLIEYSEDHFKETVADSIDEFLPLKDGERILWFSVNGIHEVEVVKKIGEVFNIHSLLLEDVLNTEQRPKMEDFEDYLFISMKAFNTNDKDEIIMEQVSIIIGENFVISFQESEWDMFAKVKERIKGEKGIIRKMGSDYLGYTLMDTIVDNYFMVMEKIGNRIEELEEDVITDPESRDLLVIKNSKRDIAYLRKSIWPLREVVRNLQMPTASLMTKEVQFFLTDVYDHIIYILDTIETFREIISSTVDIYISSVSFKMNEIIKVLTIIATIFIPLTFITGIYGMNFRFMPELRWRWGYPIIWGIMLGASALMLWIFKRKKWL